MKIIIGQLIILAMLISSCNNSQNNEEKKQSEAPAKLHIEDYDFSVKDNFKFIPYNKAIYQRGDEVYLVLKNVGPFVRGTDSLNRAEMKMEIFDALGDTVVVQENLFGERGHADFENNILKKPFAVFRPNNSNKIGKYTFKVTVYDLISGDSTSISDDFYIE